jgi:hypothetical protein
MKPLKDTPACQTFMLGLSFNPRNTGCIPVVKNLVLFKLEKKLSISQKPLYILYGSIIYLFVSTR